MTNQLNTLRREDLKSTFFFGEVRFVNEISKKMVKHIPANQLGQVHY